MQRPRSNFDFDSPSTRLRNQNPRIDYSLSPRERLRRAARGQSVMKATDKNRAKCKRCGEFYPNNERWIQPWGICNQCRTEAATSPDPDERERWKRKHLDPNYHNHAKSGRESGVW